MRFGVDNDWFRRHLVEKDRAAVPCSDLRDLAIVDRSIRLGAEYVGIFSQMYNWNCRNERLRQRRAAMNFWRFPLRFSDYYFAPFWYQGSTHPSQAAKVKNVRLVICLSIITAKPRSVWHYYIFTVKHQVLPQLPILHIHRKSFYATPKRANYGNCDQERSLSTCDTNTTSHAWALIPWCDWNVNNVPYENTLSTITSSLWWTSPIANLPLHPFS